MPCLVHLDANGKATHTNRHCKFVNDLKEDPESGYKRSRKNRPRGKGKGKKKEEESKDSSDMDEDVDPKHAAKSDDKGKNPFAKKAPVYHTFLGTPTVRQQKTSLRILMATLPQFPNTCAGQRFQLLGIGRITQTSSLRRTNTPWSSTP